MSSGSRPLSSQEIIKKFELEPHPEGGYFKQTYRSSEFIPQPSLPSRFAGDRCFSTCIYFLLPSGTKSHLHRIASDEVWHFYLGGPLMLVEISPEGRLSKTILGTDLLAGHNLQYVVRAGTWFGAYPLSGTEYSLVGCTVAPGFDFQDFEMASRATLVERYPNAEIEIKLLT